MSAVRRGLLLAALVLALASVTTPAAAAGRDDGARVAFRIEDERVIESSGLAISRTRPGLAYTVNDSGDEARVLVLSMRDGSVIGETTLTDAEADDFESLAPAPGGRLVVADIGDNDAERDSVELYVIDEPGRGDAEVEPRTVSLTYPGGPRDAEAVVVVGRSVYVVSKEFPTGAVYAAPVLASSRDAYRLRRVATAPGVVTGAARLADGRVVLRDYLRAHVVHLPDWRVRASYALPRVEQGETVAAPPRGTRVYVGTEGGDSPVHVVPVPAPSEYAEVGGPRTAQPAQSPPGGPGDGIRGRPTGYVVAVVAAIVIGLVVRRRRRRRPPRIQIR